MKPQAAPNALLDSTFIALPLGSIKPQGWLRNQLRIQADGMTGHLEEHWPDVGPESGWLGGSGESWERGPYYLDGLVPLAYLLDDNELQRKAQKWIEWALASQAEDGRFGPTHLTTVNTEVRNRDWWQDMIMLKVLTQYHEATQDPRVIPFMTRYFAYLSETLEADPLQEWARARGQDLLLSIHWLYDRTEDAELLELAEVVRKQTIDWTSIFAKFPFWRKQEQWDHRTHVVNVAMAIKAPAVFYRQTGDESDRGAVYDGIHSLMTHHGQAHGLFSGDEWLSGTHPSQGVELCAVVEYMFSLENLVRILGDGRFADVLERVAFNALPAAVSPNWDSHQYDQQVNQIMCNAAKRPWSNGPDANMFGLEPNFGCCTANMHQGWPKFVSGLWMSTRDGGLAAVSYAPCSIQTSVGNGIPIELAVSGDYPFRDSVSIRVGLTNNVEFPMLLRIPEWCAKPAVRVNGQVQDVVVENGFARVHRRWSNEDQVDVNLPMAVMLQHRNNEAVSVWRGPLVYVMPVGEQWIRVNKRALFHDWEVYPTTPWQYALVEDARFDVGYHAISYQPFQPGSPPVSLETQGQLISNWVMVNSSAGDPPLNPKAYSDNTDTLTLVPYGCARLRIGEFPVV